MASSSRRHDKADVMGDAAAKAAQEAIGKGEPFTDAALAAANAASVLFDENASQRIVKSRLIDASNLFDWPDVAPPTEDNDSVNELFDIENTTPLVG